MALAAIRGKKTLAELAKRFDVHLLPFRCLRANTGRANQITQWRSQLLEADVRKLLISGAMSRLNWICRKGIRAGSSLARMLERKPRMLVAIALANKKARAVAASSGMPEPRLRDRPH